MKPCYLFCCLILLCAFGPHDPPKKTVAEQNFSGAFTTGTGTAGGEKFTSTLHCRYRCAEVAKEKTSLLEKTFSAPARGLRRGNGNYWGSLSYHLWSWGREWCLEEASVKCGEGKSDPSKVADFGLDKMTSGIWSVTEPIDCSPRKTAILSPFDSKAGSIIDPTVPASQASETTRTSLKGKSFAAKEKPLCTVELEGKLCVGDCMAPLQNGDPEGTWRETLAAPGTADKATSLKICADSFIAEHVKSSLSDSVLTHFCENYFWNSIFDELRVFASCAAARFKSECPKVIKAMRK